MFFWFCSSFYPGQCEWVYCPGDAISSVATSEKSTGKIFIYDGRGNNQPLHVFDKLHTSPLTQIQLNPIYKVVVSSDKSGMIEYWTGTPREYKFPKNVNWEYKTDTDLYEFAKCKAYPSSISFSPDGKKMASIGSDRKVRIFRFLTGKLMRVFDESLSVSSLLFLFLLHYFDWVLVCLSVQLATLSSVYMLWGFITYLTNKMGFSSLFSSCDLTSVFLYWIFSNIL